MFRTLGAAAAAWTVALACAGSAQAAFVPHTADYTFGTKEKLWVTSFTDELKMPASIGNATWKEVVSATVNFGEGDVPVDVPARPFSYVSSSQKLSATWSFPSPYAASAFSRPMQARVRNCQRGVVKTTSGYLNTSSVSCGAPYALSTTASLRVLDPPAHENGRLELLDQWGTEDKPLSGTTLTFAASAPYAAGLVRIDWGDGTVDLIDARPWQDSRVEYVLDGFGGINVSVPHVYADGGNYTIRAGASSASCFAPPPNGCSFEDDSVGARATATITDAPTFRAAPITAVEGDTFAGRVADVDHLCSDCTYSAQIKWGDGTRTTGTIDPVTDTFRKITGSHRWTEQGSYVVETTLTITQSDQTVYRETRTATATVDDAPLFATQSYSVVLGHERFGTLRIGHLTDANPKAAPSDYIVQIDWGDGTTGQGSVVDDPDSDGFFVMGDHDYPADSDGGYRISYKVTSDRGAVAYGHAYASGHPGGLS